ncbi:MAG: hypothetical protein H6738_07985 [Alphaproteobacteria bacterium]|nr:hypothetical protein [Alphaproteobacteria bacterium]MCB9696703.1 hypothetical protein [Alphaproteobacteria bacterium]
MRTPFSLLLAAGLVGCAEPDPSELFYGATVTSVRDEASAADAFVQRIATAEDTLHVALPTGEDPTIADALIEAWDRGIQVEVVTDADVADTEGIRRLLDAEVPVRLADAGLTYFEFTLNADVVFTSEMTKMSDVWVVADSQTVLAASHVGSLADGTRILFDMKGEELIEDLLREHNQLFGGTDATAVDAYDAPNKSITDFRWRYGTDSDVDLQMWFGPQERLTKRIVDGIYGARSSIWVLTNDLANEGLSKALQDKAERGFDVRVVVGPDFGDSSSAVSRVFENETPDVDKRRVTDPVVPTLVILDWEDQPSGRRGQARGMVITHDLFNAARLYRGSPVETDQLIDGVMWELATASTPTGDLQALMDVWQDHLDRSEAF